MRRGIHLGRLYGIRITVDWSWMIILLLVTWNLAGSYFPAIHPDWSALTHWSTALLASLLFFASILAHELAHSLAAKARGIPVRQITLFLFGGVANIEREPSTPRAEFWIAFVGPLTSLVLGIVSLLLGLIGIERGTTSITNLSLLLRQLGPIQTLLVWLGPVNILLAIFNLIPGFPLDGGRVLRSILWALTKDFSRATQWAARFGQLVAWGFILAGFAMVFGVQIPLLGTGPVAGIWLAFIGWFLNNAASQSYYQAAITDLLEGVPVSRLMRSDTPAVTPQMSIETMVDNYMLGTDERAFPVLDNEEMVGLVCLSDIKKVKRDAWPMTTVAEIMTPFDQLDVVLPGDEVSDALQKFSRKDVRQLPVVERGRLLGMLRQQDILHWLQLQAGYRG